MRSIFLERSKPRYSASQPCWPADLAPAVWSHGPSWTDEFLKLPPASEKKPTVFRPPSVWALLGTMVPAPVGSYVRRSGPALLLHLCGASTEYAAVALFGPTTAWVGFFACTSHVPAF